MYQSHDFFYILFLFIIYSAEYKTVTLPVSTTYLILGMVREVSATLVATTHRRQPSGGGEKTYTQNSEKCIIIGILGWK